MTTISNNTKTNDPYIVERKRQERINEQERELKNTTIKKL